MRALFGVVSLLVVLAVVGLLASRAMKSSIQALPVASPGASATRGTTVRDQSRQMQEQVRNDVARALEQGTKRTEDADK